MTTPTPSERARKLVARFRENERVHTDEWDETRYLEQKITQAITSAVEDLTREKDSLFRLSVIQEHEIGKLKATLKQYEDEITKLKSKISA